MLVPNRHGSSTAYRYGFNGMEKDNELKGEGNSYDFGARMLDPRVGRWFARDPLEGKYPSLSPYVFSRNSPLMFKDFDGKDFTITIFVDENGNNIMQINYTIYTAAEKHTAEIQSGIDLWKTLDGSKVLLNDIEFTINLNFKVEQKTTLEDALKSQSIAKYSNVYGGNLNADGTENLESKQNVWSVKSNADGSSTLSSQALSINGGESDGDYISTRTTTITNDFSGISKGDAIKFKKEIKELSQKNQTSSGANSPNIIAHEIGHTLGLQHNLTYTSGADETTNYFSPTGVMTLGPLGPPTYTDLINLIKSRFNNKSMGSSRIEFKGEKVENLLGPDKVSPPTRENVTVKPKG
jgi:RHS repeat-associated protein